MVGEWKIYKGMFPFKMIRVKEDVGNGCYKITEYEEDTHHMMSITWYNSNDKIHRLEGPALIDYDERGNVKKETWYHHGNPLYKSEKGFTLFDIWECIIESIDNTMKNLKPFGRIGEF